MVRTVKRTALVALLCLVLASASFASTTVNASVVPYVVFPHSTVFVRTAVTNANPTGQAVTISIRLTNPGTCVTGHLPTNVGALALGLRANETRLADLSLNIPPSTCSGKYTVTVTVKNSSGVVIATHTTSFTVQIPTP
jgi:hypothetical protein